MEDLIYQGIQALKGGDKVTTRSLFESALDRNGQSAQAWLWLSGAVDTDEEKMECLQQVLKIDPTNSPAMKGMAMLMEKGVALTEQREPEKLVSSEEAPDNLGSESMDIGPTPTDFSRKEEGQILRGGWQPDIASDEAEMVGELSHLESTGEEDKPQATVVASEGTVAKVEEIPTSMEAPSEDFEMSPQVNDVILKEEMTSQSPEEIQPHADMAQIGTGESPDFEKIALSRLEGLKTEAAASGPGSKEMESDVEMPQASTTEGQPETEAAQMIGSAIGLGFEEAQPAMETPELGGTEHPEMEAAQVSAAEVEPVAEETQPVIETPEMVVSEQPETEAARVGADATQMAAGEVEPVAEEAQAVMETPEMAVPEQPEAEATQASAEATQVGATATQEDVFKLPESFFEPQQETPVQLPDWLVGTGEEEPAPARPVPSQQFVEPLPEELVPLTAAILPTTEIASTEIPEEKDQAKPVEPIREEQVTLKIRPSMVTPILGYGFGTVIMLAAISALLFIMTTNLSLLTMMGLILAVALFIFMLFMFIGITLHHLLNSYTITNRRLFLIQGVLKSRQKSIPFNKIVNVVLRQGLAQKVFRSGHITIRYLDAEEMEQTVRLIDVASAKRFISLIEEGQSRG